MANIQSINNTNASKEVAQKELSFINDENVPFLAILEDSLAVS